MIAASDTRMFAESGQAAAAVETQFAANATLYATLAARLRTLAPTVAFTCARGSSDHAATYVKFLFETQLGLPTVSQSPSVVSIYDNAIAHTRGAPFFVLSQSGRSPDLLASAQAARDAGALVIALVNDTTSPLADIAELVVPLHAGPETSVAATKSYIATLAAITGLVTAWADDAALIAQTARLPVTLARAWDADWTGTAQMLAGVDNLFVLGRGPTLGIAQEAALKFKETCGIHAEAFSIAEVAHGPMALVGRDFPVLVFPPTDAGASGLDALIERFAAQGAPVLVAGSPDLPVEPGLGPALAPIAMIQSFYRLVNAVALARGHDPDRPPLLSKVTRTR